MVFEYFPDGSYSKIYFRPHNEIDINAYDANNNLKSVGASAPKE